MGPVAPEIRVVTKRRDKAERKAKPRHGGAWHDSTEAIKAHRAAAKEAKRARRRADAAIVDEALAEVEDVAESDAGPGHVSAGPAYPSG